MRDRCDALQKGNGKSTGSNRALLVGSGGTPSRARGWGKEVANREGAVVAEGVATAATLATTTATAAVPKPVEPRQSSREPAAFAPNKTTSSSFVRQGIVKNCGGHGYGEEM